MSNVLQNIFKDHYEEMLYILHPRKSVIENVDRMINCGDPSFGGAMYGCSKCGTFKFVPFRCHSRFCPICGTKYSIDRTTSMSFKIINAQHRHCVFTIDSELRHIPEKHFKQIRYYGLYAGNHKNDSKLNLAIAKEKRKIFLSFNRWRDCILHSFGYDTLKCPCCGETMTFLDLYYNHQHISLNEMYERTMHRFHAHSSA